MSMWYSRLCTYFWSHTVFPYQIDIHFNKVSIISQLPANIFKILVFFSFSKHITKFLNYILEEYNEDLLIFCNRAFITFVAMILQILDKFLIEDVHNSYYESYFLKGFIDENADEGEVYIVSMTVLAIVMTISQLQTILYGYRISGTRHIYSRRAFVLFLILILLGLINDFCHFFLPQLKMPSYILISVLHIIIPLALLLFNDNAMLYLKLKVKRIFCNL